MLKRNRRGKNKLSTFIKQNDNNERENINQSYFFLQTSLFSFRQGGNTNQHLKEVFVNPNKCGNAQCSRPLLLLDGKYHLPENSCTQMTDSNFTVFSQSLLLV